jgi:hypothetical protein
VLRIVWLVTLASLTLSIVLAWAGRSYARYFVLPAVIVSVWSFGGHLVTLDDDAPGGWANPDEARGPWRRSLLALAVKGAAALGIGAFATRLWSA